MLEKGTPWSRGKTRKLEPNVAILDGSVFGTRGCFQVKIAYHSTVWPSLLYHRIVNEFVYPNPNPSSCMHHQFLSTRFFRCPRSLVPRVLYQKANPSFYCRDNWDTLSPFPRSQFPVLNCRDMGDTLSRFSRASQFPVLNCRDKPLLNPIPLIALLWYVLI